MPIFSQIVSKLKFLRAFSSPKYWEMRYERGGNSGPGSYGDLAKFKARILNQFVEDHRIRTVIEFGCGDGNQLTLARYLSYTGYDISPIAIQLCRNKFANDSTKKFGLVTEYTGEQADLAISLDVIFHLTEDDVFHEYMRKLFGSASRFVIIYSSNQYEPIKPVSAHVKHRRFSDWIDRELGTQWKLLTTIPNAHPYNGNSEQTSFSDFFIYERL
jgi:SAM-dependent methyltransferase